MNATIIKNAKVPTTKEILDFVIAINVSYMPMYVIEDWPTMIDAAKEMKKRGMEGMIRFFNNARWDKRIESLIKESDFDQEVWGKIEDQFKRSAMSKIERFFDIEGDELYEDIAESHYGIIKYVASTFDYASNKPSDPTRLNRFVSIFDSAFKYIKKDDINYEVLKKSLKRYRLFTRINIHNAIGLDIEDIDFIKDSLIESVNSDKTIRHKNIFNTACRLNIDYKKFVLDSDEEKANLYRAYILDFKADGKMLQDLFKLGEHHLESMSATISFLCSSIDRFEDKDKMIISFLECNSKSALKSVALRLPIKYLYIMTQVPTIRKLYSDIVQKRIQEYKS
ncbi:hypothetical protein N9W84_00805 [bacterium]|nr:hypothetical protein [bacterium]